METWSDHWNELREKRQLVFQATHRAKDGRVYPVEIHSNFVEVDGREYNCAFARKQTVAPKVLNLNETLEGMLNMLRQLIGEDIDLAWLPGKNLDPVRMDPSQIEQLLANLCVNARDAIHDTGKITVETGTVTMEWSSRTTDSSMFTASRAKARPSRFTSPGTRPSLAGQL